MPVPGGHIIEPIASVYGLNDATLLWHRTLFLHRAPLVVARHVSLHQVSRDNVSDITLTGVGDSRRGAGRSQDQAGAFRASRATRDMWARRGAYKGTCTPSLWRAGRAIADPETLTHEELVVLISLLDKFNSAVVGAASVLTQLLTRSATQGLRTCNMVARGSRSTASQGNSVCRLHLADISLILVRDVGRVGQMQVTCRRHVQEKFEPLRFYRRRHSRWRRVVNSSCASETQAASASTAESPWLHIMTRDAVHAGSRQDRCRDQVPQFVCQYSRRVSPSTAGWRTS